ncbi:MAG: ATP-binding protein [Candidatus Limisoma sp.]
MEYLRRNIDAYLQQWKVEEDRKPLLIRGARQVGKSCAVRHFGASFDYFLEVNFERDSDVADIFGGKADVHDIAEKLSIYYGVPVEPGKTLLFLDEIQSCPKALHSLWFFREDYPELHVIAAGSLLEFALKDLRSYGVGRISSLFVYPMSFDEFLKARKLDGLVEMKRQATAEKPLIEVFHTKLVEQYRQFMLIGGMPAAVAKFVETESYMKARTVLADLRVAYIDDFSKYAGRINPDLLRYTLISVARQAGTKFVFSQVDGGYRTEQVKTALSYLRDAGLIVPVFHSASNGIPLGAEVNSKFVKYLMIDNALMLDFLGISDDIKDETNSILTDSATELVDKGNVAEMMAGLEILKYMSPHERHELYYWQDTNKGNVAEVDYVVAKGGHVVPIEVKSGVKGSMRSLYELLSKPQKDIPYAIRCSLENFGTFTSPSGKPITICPLYAISNL